MEIGRDRFRALGNLRQQDGKKERRQGDAVYREHLPSLGFANEEAEHLLVRADLLIHQVQKAITSSGLKQAEAAKTLGVMQPRVSDLLRGRIDVFGPDALIDMLATLGVGVRLVVKPSRNRRVA